MLDPELRRYVIMRRLLNQMAESFINWHRRARESITPADPFYWHQRMAELSPDEVAEVEALSARIPDVGTLDAIEATIARLGAFTLASEDALYLADSRSKLISCQLALRRGELREAWEWADSSRERLTWLVHGRKRETVRTGRHPSAEVMGELEVVIHHIEDIVTALRRGAAA